MIKKIICISIIFSIALSCSDEGVQRKQTLSSDIQVENGRLVFRDDESYQATLTELKKMSGEDLTKWRKQFSFQSMNETLRDLKADDVRLPDEVEEYSDIPPVYVSIMNSKGEFKVGAKIIWHGNGKIYRVSTEEELASIKVNPSTTFVAGEYTSSQVEVSSDRDEATGARTVPKYYHAGVTSWVNPNSDNSNLNSNVYANISPEFSGSNCGDSKKRRFVDKLISYIYVGDRDPIYQWYSAELYLVLKLQYKNPSGDWVTSHAPHDYDYTLAGSVNDYHFDGTLSRSSGYLYFEGHPTGTTEHEWIHLMDFGGPETSPVATGKMGWFEVNLVGTISHDHACYNWVNTW